MQTENKTIVLPSGIKAVLRPYVTGRTKRAMKAALLGGAEVNVVGKESSVTGIKAGVLADAEDVAIQAIVVELAGSPDNILSRVLDLEVKDFDALVQEINKITDEESFLGK